MHTHMFSTDDYLTYFDQLYAVEEQMEKEAHMLKERIPYPEAQKLLAIIEADEKRHKELVRGLAELVRAHSL